MALLSEKYRPTMFKHVVGQPEVVSVLQEYLKSRTLPHALLFVGPSGTGKTTTARIVASKLNCNPGDFYRINASSARGIDAIREVEDKIGINPMFGDGCKVYLFEECHKLTSDAQSALLTIVEEVPDHAYFLFCTTNPEKLSVPLRQRFTPIQFNKIPTEIIRKLIVDVAAKEGRELSDEVLTILTERSNNAARIALRGLETILLKKTEEEQLAALEAFSEKAVAERLGPLLMQDQISWGSVRKVLENSMEDPEDVRRMILGMAKNILLENSKPDRYARAYRVIVAFSKNYYDTGAVGLVESCFRVYYDTKK